MFCPRQEETRESLASMEASKLKKLMGGLRYLFRNGAGSNDEHILALKKLLKQSPLSQQRLARRGADDGDGEELDASSGHESNGHGDEASEEGGASNEHGDEADEESGASNGHGNEASEEGGASNGHGDEASEEGGASNGHGDEASEEGGAFNGHEADEEVDVFVPPSTMPRSLVEALSPSPRACAALPDDTFDGTQAIPPIPDTWTIPSPGSIHGRSDVDASLWFSPVQVGFVNSFGYWKGIQRQGCRCVSRCFKVRHGEASHGSQTHLGPSQNEEPYVISSL